MSWMELSLDTTSEAVDWVCTLLAAVPETSDVQITPYPQTDKTPADEKTLADQASVQPEWTFSLCFYLPNDRFARDRVDRLTTLLSPLHRTDLTTALDIAIVETKTIAANSRQGDRIGQRFVVLPTNVLTDAKAQESIEQAETTDTIWLKLKPSLAFGSGLHPATRLIFQLLERHVVAGMHTLDLGSGSGILSVAMAKLGAQVLALDNDPIAVQATQDAVNENQVGSLVTVQAGSLGSGSTLGHWMGGEAIDSVPTIQPIGNFDLIAANILARVHVTLAPDFYRALRRSDGDGGLLVVSGFTTDYAADVDAALVAEGFQAIEQAQWQEWVAGVYSDGRGLR